MPDRMHGCHARTDCKSLVCIANSRKTSPCKKHRYLHCESARACFKNMTACSTCSFNDQFNVNSLGFTAWLDCACYVHESSLRGRNALAQSLSTKTHNGRKSNSKPRELQERTMTSRKSRPTLSLDACRRKRTETRRARSEPRRAKRVSRADIWICYIPRGFSHS